MQSQKTVFRPLNARTPPAADTDRAGPALPPSKRISKGNRQSAFPRKGFVAEVSSRSSTSSGFPARPPRLAGTVASLRRNGDTVSPERRYRCAGTAARAKRVRPSHLPGRSRKPAVSVSPSDNRPLPPQTGVLPAGTRELFHGHAPSCVVSGVQAACFTMDGRKRLPAPFPKRRAKGAPASVRICEKECADGR